MNGLSSDDAAGSDGLKHCGCGRALPCRHCAVSPSPDAAERVPPLTAQQLGLCGPLSDDTSVGPDAARHTPPAGEPAARTDRPYGGDATTRALIADGERVRRERNEWRAQADTYAARQQHALHVRDVALAGVAAAQSERDEWKARHASAVSECIDRNGQIAELQNGLWALRDRLAAVRALADDLPDLLQAYAWSHQDGTWLGYAEFIAGRIRAVLDGPTEVPADPHLSEWQTQMRGFLGKRVEVVLNKDPRKVVVGVLHHFDTDGQVYVEDEDGSWGWAWPCLDIAVAVGPAEAAEPARPEWAILNPPTGLMADLREELRIEQETAAEAGATEPAPAPGYPRIADAITAACEAADIDLTVVHDGRVLDYVPGVAWLATVLDKAGLIDWAAFQDEAGSVTTTPDPAARINNGDKLRQAIADRLGFSRDEDWPADDQMIRMLAAEATAADATEDGRKLNCPDCVQWSVYGPEAEDQLIQHWADIHMRRVSWNALDGSPTIWSSPASLDADAERRTSAPGEPALIGTYADPAFVAHQDHKHPVDDCGYCPTDFEETT